MNKLKTVDSKVLAILRECPETRYDDMQLILCYYNRYSYMRVGDLPLEDIVNNYKGYGLPCFETIRNQVIMTFTYPTPTTIDPQSKTESAIPVSRTVKAVQWLRLRKHQNCD